MRENMQKKKLFKINCFVDWIIHILVYTITLLVVSLILNTIDIDKSLYGIYAFIAALIIYLLNKTIKPILVRLTIPITGLTQGLFYPCINIIILKITDFLLGNHFNTSGIITLFLTAILISIMNILMEKIIINKVIGKGDKNG